MTRRAARGLAAFTLVEVMIAIVLSMIAVIGVTALYMAETAASTDSRQKTEAAVLCEDKMEWLRTQSAPTSGSETGLDELGGIGGMYDRTWTVTTGTSYIDYSVTVNWDTEGLTGCPGAARLTCRSETLRSRRGL